MTTLKEDEEELIKKRNKEYEEHRAEIAKLKVLLKYHKHEMSDIERSGLVIN